MTQRICAKKHISSHSFVNWLLSKCYFNNVLMFVKKLRSFDKFVILLFFEKLCCWFSNVPTLFPSPYTSQSILYSNYSDPVHPGCRTMASTRQPVRRVRRASSPELRDSWHTTRFAPISRRYKAVLLLLPLLLPLLLLFIRLLLRLFIWCCCSFAAFGVMLWSLVNVV